MDPGSSDLFGIYAGPSGRPANSPSGWNKLDHLIPLVLMDVPMIETDSDPDGSNWISRSEAFGMI